jgi:hypothetical protein
MIWWYDMIYDMIYDMMYMIRYDTIWYDMIWYDIWYDIYDMTRYDTIWYDMIWYLLTATGLSPGGSTHLHTNNTWNNTNNNRTTQIQTNVEECGPCPVFASFTLAFALQLRKKRGKTSVRLRKPSVNCFSQILQANVTVIRKIKPWFIPSTYFTICFLVTNMKFSVILIEMFMFIFNYALQPFKAYCAILVRRSNFRHQTSPRVSPRESTQRWEVEL